MKPENYRQTDTTMHWQVEYLTTLKEVLPGHQGHNPTTPINPKPLKPHLYRKDWKNRVHTDIFTNTSKVCFSNGIIVGKRVEATSPHNFMSNISRRRKFR